MRFAPLLLGLLACEGVPASSLNSWLPLDQAVSAPTLEGAWENGGDCVGVVRASRIGLKEDRDPYVVAGFGETREQDDSTDEWLLADFFRVSDRPNEWFAQVRGFYDGEMLWLRLFLPVKLTAEGDSLVAVAVDGEIAAGGSAGLRPRLSVIDRPDALVIEDPTRRLSRWLVRNWEHPEAWTREEEGAMEYVRSERCSARLERRLEELDASNDVQLNQEQSGHEQQDDHGGEQDAEP